MNHENLHEDLLCKDVEVYTSSSDSSIECMYNTLVQEFLCNLKYSMLSKDFVKIENLKKNMVSFENFLLDLVEKVVTNVPEQNLKEIYISLTECLKHERTYPALTRTLINTQKSCYIYEIFNETVVKPLLKLAINHKLINLIKRLKHICQTSNKPELEDLSERCETKPERKRFI
ncbi:MAG: hypothetical protein QXJ64_04710 [Thermosphaera sp.]